MTVQEHPDFEVGIIGGGPGGAATAAYLARQGISCVVFEQELFPRPHVGESLVPSSTRVLKELGFLEAMEEAGFVRKYGAAWSAGAGRPTYEHDWAGVDEGMPSPKASNGSEGAIRFEERHQPGVDRPYTWHVDRARFDLMLLQHAHQLGAKVYEGVRVTGVDFSEPFPVVRYNIGRRTFGTQVRTVVDASGRHTLLGNQLRLKVKDPVFDQYALHAWYEGFDRAAVFGSQAVKDYNVIHFIPEANTWIWQIPISESVTSIGLVTQKKNFAKRREEREAFFWSMAETRPDVAEALRRARQIRPFTEEGDYSYSMKQVCGDRFVLVGDAGRFVDPIFSTGVSIALNSARLASTDIRAALEKGDFSRPAFAEFEAMTHRGMANWYEFISIYYRLNVLFTYFVGDPRYRLDVLKLLQGDVYDEEAPAVLQRMREMVSKVEQNERHPWHALLGTLTANAFRPRAA